MTDNKKMKPIVFCNIGWCNDYIGDENLAGGGSYVKENGHGNEDMNFFPITVTEEGSEEQRLREGHPPGGAQPGGEGHRYPAECGARQRDRRDHRDHPLLFLRRGHRVYAQCGGTQ